MEVRWRHTEREEKRDRQTETLIFIFWFMLQMVITSRVGPGQTQESGTISVSNMGGWGPKICCLPKFVSRKLEWKWSS